MFLVLSGIYLGVELLGHMVTLHLTFWEIARLFSKVAESFYISNSRVCSFQFSHISPTFVICLFKKRFYLFLERGKGKEKERERNINAWLPLAHPALGIWSATQECALTGNWTSDPLVWTGQHSVHWATPTRAVFLIIWSDASLWFWYALPL